MDTDRLARIRLASLTLDEQALRALIVELAAAIDSLNDQVLALRHEVGRAREKHAVAQDQAAVHKQNADRLAQWIINHAVGEHEGRTALLDQHDRTR